jgi:glutamine synthetase
MKEGRAPQDEFTGDAYDTEADIPRTFGEALELFDRSDALRAVLGTEFCKVYAAVKDLEYQEFLQVISPWEREHLLLNV